MHKLKHIWFDMDGTLTIHTNKFTEAHNILRYETYASLVGREVNDDVINDFEKLYKKYGSNSAVFTHLGKESDFWMQHFDKLDQDLYYEPVADVYDTLDKLRKKVPISLFTNAKLKNAQKTMSVIKVDMGWFTSIISGDDVPNRKPALDGFSLIIQRSKLPASQILYVGDRVDVDIKPARKLGMKTCLVYSKSSQADYSINSIRDLLTLL